MLYLRADQSDMNSFDDRFVKLELSSKWTSCLILSVGTYHLLVDYQTNITLGENTSVVRINQTDCLSTTETGQEALVKGVDVDMELCDDGGMFLASF
jgi:hypothetical protein